MTVKGPAKLITELKDEKAQGPDCLRKQYLTIITEFIAKGLSRIFDVALKALKVPKEWKLAHVIPWLKKGPWEQVCNYLPVSLTGIPGKICWSIYNMLEHIVFHYLNEKIDFVLRNSQHSFRQGLSCETLKTFHYLDKDKSCPIHAAVLDLQTCLIRFHTNCWCKNLTHR